MSTITLHDGNSKQIHKSIAAVIWKTKFDGYVTLRNIPQEIPEKYTQGISQVSQPQYKPPLGPLPAPGKKIGITASSSNTARGIKQEIQESEENDDEKR